MPGKRSDTMAENNTASFTRNLGILLLRMAMISTTASSVPTTWHDNNNTDNDNSNDDDINNDNDMLICDM